MALDDLEAPYSLRSYVSILHGIEPGIPFTDVDYKVADGIFNDVPALFRALEASGCIEPAGWSGDRSVISWHITAAHQRHQHDLRWNPQGFATCIDSACPLVFRPPVDATAEWVLSWPPYTGPVPESE